MLSHIQGPERIVAQSVMFAQCDRWLIAARDRWRLVVCWTVRFWSAAPNRFADAMRPPHDLGFGERFGAYLPLVTHARNEYPCVPVPVFSVLCLGTWRVSCGCAPWRPRRERWFKRWGRYRRQFTGTAATPLSTHRRFLALWDRQWTLTLHAAFSQRHHRRQPYAA